MMPARCRPRVDRALELLLGVVEHLGGVQVGEPAVEDALLLPVLSAVRVEVGRAAVVAGQVRLPRHRCRRGSAPRRRRRAAPCGQGHRPEAHRQVVDGEDLVAGQAALDLVLLDLEHLEQPVAQDHEPGRRRRGGYSSRSQVWRSRSAMVSGRSRVVDEPVEPPVARNAIEVDPQVLAERARLVDVGHDTRRVAVLPSHFAAVFGPTPGTPGRLSLVSPTSAAKIAVPLGRDKVLLGDRRRVHAPHLGDPAPEYSRVTVRHQAEGRRGRPCR